jgi:hypothetical protein
MAGIDVLLDAAQITVLGPPQTIDLQLDVGATGQRGSQIYAGAGLPSSSTIPNFSSILPGDLYINISPGPNYSWLYQYLVRPAGNVWEPILRINPAIFNALYSVNFVDGEAEISIPITNITTLTASYTIDNFAVEFSFQHDNPISAVISNKLVVSNNLVLDFKAIEFVDGNWEDLNASALKMSLSVNIVTGATVV